MRLIINSLVVGLVSVGMGLTEQREAAAQYPYTINATPTYVVPAQAYAPAVVGYTAERRGLFGRRTVFKPVLGPSVAQPVAVAAPLETVTQATAIAPVPVTSSRPVISPAPIYSTPVASAPVVVSQRVVTANPVVVSRPVVGTQRQVVVARPVVAPTVVSPPVVIAPPPVITQYYPPVYPAPFAPVVGF